MSNLSEFGEVRMTAQVILGETKLSVQQIAVFEKGTIIDLGVSGGSNASILINDKKIGTGEIMVFEKNLAVRIKTIEEI